MAEPQGRLPLFLRQKINAVVPGEFPGRAFVSALPGNLRKLLLDDSTQTPEYRISAARIADGQALSNELQGLRKALRAIRYRILANTLLGGWTNWLTWVLIVLIV